MEQLEVCIQSVGMEQSSLYWQDLVPIGRIHICSAQDRKDSRQDFQVGIQVDSIVGW